MPRTKLPQPRWVDDDLGLIARGSSFLTTAGLNDIAPLGQTGWAEQLRIVAELDTLRAEVDALKRLQLQAACHTRRPGETPKRRVTRPGPKTWRLDVITFVITLAA